jgi:hypothetical protein
MSPVAARLDLAADVALQPIGLVSSVAVVPGFTLTGYDDLIRSLVNTFGARPARPAGNAQRKPIDIDRRIAYGARDGGGGSSPAFSARSTRSAADASGQPS